MSDSIIAWALIILLGIPSFIIEVAFIYGMTENFDFRRLVNDKKGILEFMVVFIGGIISIGLVLLAAKAWLGISIEWALFVLFGILGLLMIGRGLYDIYDFDRSTGIKRITVGIISIGLTLAISNYWLNNLAGIINTVGQVFFWVLIITGGLATILGGFLTIVGSGAENKEFGFYLFIGGAIGIGLALVIGSFALYRPLLMDTGLVIIKLSIGLAIITIIAKEISWFLKTPAKKEKRALDYVKQHDKCVVYDRYKSGYIRIRFISQRFKRTILEVTVDDPRLKPGKSRLAVINSNFSEELFHFLRNNERLENSGKGISNKDGSIHWMMEVPANILEKIDNK